MLVTDFFQSQSRISSYRILVNNMNRVFTTFCHCLHRRSCIYIKSCNCSIWQSSWQHTHLHSPCLVPPVTLAATNRRWPSRHKHVTLFVGSQYFPLAITTARYLYAWYRLYYLQLLTLFRTRQKSKKLRNRNGSSRKATSCIAFRRHTL